MDYKTDYEHSKAVYNSAVQRYEELKNGNRPQEITQAKANSRSRRLIWNNCGST